jgi:hypothetical protein
MYLQSINTSSFLDSINNRHQIERHKRKYDYLMQSANKIEMGKFGSVKLRKKTVYQRGKKHSLRSNSKHKKTAPAYKNKQKVFNSKKVSKEEGFPTCESAYPHEEKLDIITVTNYEKPKINFAKNREVIQENLKRRNEDDNLAAEKNIQFESLKLIKAFASRVLNDKNIEKSLKLEIIILLNKWKSDTSNPIYKEQITSLLSKTTPTENEIKNFSEKKSCISNTNQSKDLQYLKTGTLMKVIDDSNDLSGK